MRAAETMGSVFEKVIHDYGYSIYLFVEIGKGQGLIDKNEDLDTAWDKAFVWHSDFETSEFNDLDKGLYECVLNYVNYLIKYQA